MLTLYYKPTCPYCQNVLGEARALGVKFRLKDISSDEHLRDELFEQSAGTQVPFLIDPERGVKMLESQDIIAYLQEHYSGGTQSSFGGLRVHKSEEVCDTCQ